MSKYTKSARGQDCQIRIPGVCNFNPETTVFAHINGAGWGLKQPDIIGAYACSACHDAVDHRIDTQFDAEEIEIMQYEGMVRTQNLMIKNGVLKL